MRRVLLSLLLTLVAAHAWSHADHEQRLNSLSSRLDADPQDSAALISRAEIYREQRDWDRAQADYAAARRLRDDPVIDLLEGRMWAEAQRPDRALPLLDKYLAVAGDDARGWIWRARAQLSGAPLAAAADFRTAVARSPRPGPDLYLEYADALQAASNPAAALAVLDAAVERLGPLVTLISRAIEFEQEPVAALAWTDRLPPMLLETPQWRATRGDLLARAGRDAAARDEYLEAIALLDDMPAARRDTRAMTRLEEQVRTALQSRGN